MHEGIAHPAGIPYPATGPRRPADGAAVLTELRSLVGAARAGRSGFVLLQGRAGSGASTMLRSVRETFLDSGAAILRASGRTNAPPAPHATIRTLMAPLGVSLPDLPNSPNSPDLPDLTGHSRQVTAVRVHNVLAEAAAGRLVALLVDDAHLCDEDSLRCLDHVLRRGAGLPLLMLLTDHPDEPGPGRQVVRELAVRSPSRVIALPELRPYEVAEVVCEMLGEPPEGTFTLRCTEVSGGNPRLLRRLLEALRRRRIRPDARGALVVERVARTVGAALTVADLARHGAQVHRAAQAAALLGASSESDLIGALAQVPRAAADTALGILRRDGALPPARPDDRCGRVRSGLRFRLFATLSPPDLRTLRTRAAGLLNEAGRPAEEIARFLPDSPDAPWMRDILREAAADTARRGAFPVAAAFLDRLIRTDASAASDHERIEVRLFLAQVLSRTNPAAALPHLRWVLNRATDPRLRTHATVRFAAAAAGSAAGTASFLDEALAALDAEATRSSGTSDAELRADAEYGQLTVAMLGHSHRCTIEPVVAGPPAVEDTAAERRLLLLRALAVALETGSREHAVALVRRGLRAPELFREGAGWPVRPELPAAVVLYLADEITEARALLGRAYEEATRQVDPLAELLVLSSRSLISHSVGDVTSAEAEARAALSAVARTPEAARLLLPRIAHLQVLVERGQVDLAQEFLDRHGHRRTPGTLYEQHLLWTVIGRLKLSRGDAAGALRVLSRCESGPAVGISNPVFNRWQLPTCRALRMLGRVSAIAELAEESHELAIRWNTARAIGNSVLIRSVAAADDESRCMELLEEAIEVLTDSPGRIELVWAEYRLGVILLRRGDLRAARRHLNRADTLATHCGSLRLSSLARTALTAAGDMTRPLAGTLTRSERRVAELAAQGASNREIADELFLARRTVETHLTNVYHKLPTGRAELCSALDLATDPDREAGASGEGSPAGGGATERSPVEGGPPGRSDAEENR